MKYVSLLSCFVLSSASYGAVSLDLDFGNADLQTNLSFTGVIDYGVVSYGVDNGYSDVYARLSVVSTAGNSYSAGTDGGSGGAVGDGKINQAGNTSTQYVLSLYEDSGYTQLFDPGTSFSFDLFFYDIDGASDSDPITSNAEAANATYYDDYYDIVTVYTASTYEVTADSRLDISTDPFTGAVSASGIDGGGVEGQAGLTSFELYQANVAISFTFTDEAEIYFGYEVVGDGGTTSGRNLLFDGNNLTFDGIDTPIGAVPEPSSFAALAALLGLASGFHRRRK
ncbi:MAG: PEP-CTERM sorting domain-containing protein [Verrucomicrobiales bacterium]